MRSDDDQSAVKTAKRKTGEMPVFQNLIMDQAVRDYTATLPESFYHICGIDAVILLFGTRKSAACFVQD